MRGIFSVKLLCSIHYETAQLPVEPKVPLRRRAAESLIVVNANGWRTFAIMLRLAL
jgi:hypothetical protein